MKYFFKIQGLRLFRWFEDKGLNPLLGLVLGLLFFLVLSLLLFYKTEYASLIYIIVAITMLFNLSEEKRNDMLQKVFPTKEYRKIRVLENVLLGLPFIIFLFFEKEFMVGLTLVPFSVALSFFKTKQHIFKTIPTPFKKIPFEFIVGFRKTFLLIGLAYFIILQAMKVDNYELGLFGLGVIFFISMSFYQKPESKHFVSIYSDRPDVFLMNKFLTSVLCVSILSCIALLMLLVGFSGHWKSTMLILILGYIFVGSMIVAKYSAYPFEMNLPQVVLYSVSLVFPPLLLFTIWVFYSKSKKNLEPYL